MVPNPNADEVAENHETVTFQPPISTVEKVDSFANECGLDREEAFVTLIECGLLHMPP
jgi:hypothetical protein